MKVTNILVASAMMLLMAVSCKKQNDNASSLQTTANGKSKISLLAENDCQCCDTGSVDLDFYAPDGVSPVSGANAGKYSSWETKVTELCPNGLKVKNEGPFGSFFRINVGGQSGWNVGAVPTSTANNWCDILSVLESGVNTRCESNGPADTTSVYAPPASSPRTDIIGLNGSTAGLNFALGYYIYNPNRTTNIINDIIVWKNCNNPGICTDAADATIAYRIRVTAADALPFGTGYAGNVKYSWECISITSCE